MSKKSGCKKNEKYIRGLGCRPKTKIRQINNITIFYDDAHMFGCKSSDNKILKQDLTYRQAINLTLKKRRIG